MAVCCFVFRNPNFSGVQKGPQTSVCRRVQESVLQTVYLANCFKCITVIGSIRESKAAHIKPGE